MEEGLRRAGQSHLLAHVEELSLDQRAELFSVIQRADFAHLNRIVDASLDSLKKGFGAGQNIGPPLEDAIFDVERERRAAAATDGKEGLNMLALHERKGYELISRGRGAVLLLAGGSGTRLGVSYPKGLFTYRHEEEDAADGAAALLLRQRDKSLFQFHCERLRKVEDLAHEAVGRDAHCDGRLHLLVMTSQQNDEETQQFFREHHYFGLQEDQVTFFIQSSLPVYDNEVHEGDVDSDGKPVHRVLMESNGKLLMAPGGNGGVYECLASGQGPGAAQASVLDTLERLGVEYVQIFSVDNLLAKIGDPLFFGIAAARRYHVTVKTTPKVSAEEAVGVFARIGGQWGVVEYTELGRERACLRTDAGGLLFNCANISSYCCSTAFLKFAAVQSKDEVLYHAAVKKVMTDDGTQERMGIKLEAFIFDMFRYCNDPRVREEDGAAAPHTSMDRFGIVQVDRRSEFAPIKNATSASAVDNPRTAAQLYVNMTTGWVRRCLETARRDCAVAALTGEGAVASESRQALAAALGDAGWPALTERVQRALACLADPSLPGGGGEGDVYVEVSPLVSYAGEGIAAYLPFLLSAIPDTHRSPPDGNGAMRKVLLLSEAVRPSASLLPL